MPKGYRGITLFPFIILNNVQLKKDAVIINHEKIHIRQQLELLIFPFFIWYSIEFILKYFKYKNWNKAYSSISFEKEAYQNEKDIKFLTRRPFWNFINYL